MDALQLQSCMAIMFETARVFFERSRQLIYLDDISLYNHISAFPLAIPIVLATGEPSIVISNVGGMLDILEPFLPLTLDEENFDLFLRAAAEMENTAVDPAASGSSYEPEAGADGTPNDLPDYFTQKARVDFIRALYDAHSPERFAQIYASCESIRALREEWEQSAKPS